MEAAVVDDGAGLIVIDVGMALQLVERQAVEVDLVELRVVGDDKGDLYTIIPGLQSKSGISLLTRRTVYETSMALVTFSFGAVFGIVMVRMPSSTLAEIWSFTTSSGNS